ncbi:MAG: hypothetical protein JW976_02245 [Syntrophaceae bacterium]|nr:hypothetical protein [Syntrophaceae bacterium]
MDDLVMDETWAKIQKEKLFYKLQKGDISQERFDASDKNLDESIKEREIRTNKILEIRYRDREEKEKILKEKLELYKQDTEEF